MGNEVIPVVPFQELEGVTLTPELLATPQFVAQYQQLVETAKRIAELKANVDSAIKDVVRERFLETGDATVISDGYRYTYVPETTAERFDSKALKAEDPIQYKRYVKVTHVSDSIRISPTKSNDKTE